MVGIPRKQGPPWSEIEHVLFVKHDGDGPITFHPVKASTTTTAAVSGPSKPRLTLTSSSHEVVGDEDPVGDVETSSE